MAESVKNKSTPQELIKNREKYKKYVYDYMQEHGQEFSLKFIRNADVNISMYTEHIWNQLVVRIGNRYITLPHGIKGMYIKDFLGSDYHKIETWSIMPDREISAKPFYGDQQ